MLSQALKHLNLLPIDGTLRSLGHLGHARMNVRRLLGATDVPEAGDGPVEKRVFPSALSPLWLICSGGRKSSHHRVVVLSSTDNRPGLDAPHASLLLTCFDLSSRQDPVSI